MEKRYLQHLESGETTTDPTTTEGEGTGTTTDDPHDPHNKKKQSWCKCISSVDSILK